MRRTIGTLLFDGSELHIRIYLIENTHTTLLIAHTMYLPSLELSAVVEVLADFFGNLNQQKVETWVCASRNLPRHMCQKIAEAIGMPIEPLSPVREQEALCYGLCMQGMQTERNMV